MKLKMNCINCYSIGDKKLEYIIYQENVCLNNKYFI